MAAKERGIITYEIHDDFDHVFDEKGNTFLAMRKLTWGEGTNPKYDLRKWYTNSEGEEVVGKGLSFLTEAGPDNLTDMLVEQGFGNTECILEALKTREDFSTALNNAVGEDSAHYDAEIADDFYDTQDLVTA